MQTDVLIIGQVICGTFLSRELERAGLSYVVIDEERPLTASRAAAGLINPVTGRRLVKTWMIDELLPFVQEEYRQAGEDLGASFLRPARVVDFFPTPQMRLAFLKRYEEDPQYLQLPADDHSWDSLFRYELGYGMIDPCYLVDLPGLLAASRKKMLAEKVLWEEKFDPAALILEKGELSQKNIHYKDITAGRIIFCDGVESFINPWFSLLPFAPNKGEALVVEIPDLSTQTPMVFKKGMSLAPWRDGL